MTFYVLVNGKPLAVATELQTAFDKARRIERTTPVIRALGVPVSIVYRGEECTAS